MNLRQLHLLIGHMYRVWQAGQLRFRLETFGLYYPALPYRAPGWRLSPRSLYLLLRQVPAYAHWVAEMEALQHRGPASWWEQTGRNRRRGETATPTGWVSSEGHERIDG